MKTFLVAAVALVTGCVFSPRSASQQPPSDPGVSYNLTLELVQAVCKGQDMDFPSMAGAGKLTVAGESHPIVFDTEPKGKLSLTITYIDDDAFKAVFDELGMIEGYWVRHTLVGLAIGTKFTGRYTWSLMEGDEPVCTETWRVSGQR